MTCRMTKLSVVSWVAQPDSTGGLSYHTVKTFSASGAGSTTTIVSTTLGAQGDTNDDFVGYIVECTDADNTQNQGLRRRILANNDATNTLTTDAFPAATSSGDQFLLMIPPHALCVASDTNNTSNYIVTRDRDEADDYWDGAAAEGGPYIEVVAADNASTTNHPMVVDSSNANQHIVFNSTTNLNGAVAVGDYFELWHHPEVMNDALLECTEELIDRRTFTGYYGSQASRAGNRAASGTLELAFRGPGAGRIGSHAECHEPYRCVFDATNSGGNSTADAGCTTTSFAYTVGNHAVGQMGVTSDGYVVMVTADSGSAYTVTPAMGVAPAAGATLYGMTTYKPTTCINLALAIKQWRGKQLIEYVWGAVPSVAISGERGGWLKIALNFQGADCMQIGASGTEPNRTWYPRLPTVAPVKLGNMRAMVDGVSWGLRTFSFDPGLDIQPKPNLAAPNDTDGFEIVNDNPAGQLEVFYDASTRKSIDDFLAGKEIGLMIQAGSTPGYPGVKGIYCHRIRYTGKSIGDDAGQMTLTLPFQVATDTTSTLPRWAVGVA